MDIISDFNCVKIAFGFAGMPGFHKVGISYANGWYNELVGAFRPVSRERKAPFLVIECEENASARNRAARILLRNTTENKVF